MLWGVMRKEGYKMVHTHCIYYGIYSDENPQIRQQGEILNRFSYWDHEQKIVLENAEIININRDDITVKTEANGEVTVSLAKIESLDAADSAGASQGNGMSYFRMAEENPDLFSKAVALDPKGEVRGEVSTH